MLVQPMLPVPYVVDKVRQETHDTFTLELNQPGTKAGFSFLPGQFNMLYVFGVGEVPISISGDPLAPRPLVHTTRAVGTVTAAMRKLKRGDMLGVRGPFGTHWPIEQATGDDIILVAGGIGLAPLRPVLYHVLAHRSSYGKVVLLYGTRSPADILFQKELEVWRGRFDIEALVTVDRSSDHWRGNVGVVTNLIRRAGFDPHHSTAFVCGPEVMMHFTVLELGRRGVPDNRVFVSMERNMKCAVGFCGHCQYGPTFICKDGPVFRFDHIRWLFGKREV
ncbi:MAG: FAD/NAD(P)-binding protein [Blastocatellia bacterium]|nr:FAD/NAD(P)-binding protein [Blastocatellia bacterium]